MLKLVVILACAASSQASYETYEVEGHCGIADVIQNFSYELLDGTWFQCNWQKDNESDRLGCATLNFAQIGDTHLNVVFNYMYHDGRQTHTDTETVFQSIWLKETSYGNLKRRVKVEDDHDSPFNVLKLVANEYAIIYNCAEISDTHKIVQLWILAKNWSDCNTNTFIKTINSEIDYSRTNLGDLIWQTGNTELCKEVQNAETPPTEIITTEPPTTTMKPLINDDSLVCPCLCSNTIKKYVLVDIEEIKSNETSSSFEELPTTPDFSSAVGADQASVITWPTTAASSIEYEEVTSAIVNMTFDYAFEELEEEDSPYYESENQPKAIEHATSNSNIIRCITTNLVVLVITLCVT